MDLQCLWGRGAVTTRRLLAGSDCPGICALRSQGLIGVDPPVLMVNLGESSIMGETNDGGLSWGFYGTNFFHLLVSHMAAIHSKNEAMGT